MFLNASGNAKLSPSFRHYNFVSGHCQLQVNIPFYSIGYCSDFIKGKMNALTKLG